MTTQQITAIALRILAIWLLVQLVLGLPAYMMLLSTIGQYEQQEASLFFRIALLVTFVLIGLIVAFFINKTANSVLVKSRFESDSTLSDESQQILFQFAGLYFVVNALSKFPESLAFLVNATQITASSLLWSSGLIFELAIGLWLVSSPVFWRRLFIKLRGRA